MGAHFRPGRACLVSRRVVVHHAIRPSLVVFAKREPLALSSALT
jgi:hypothetical protein